MYISIISDIHQKFKKDDDLDVVVFFLSITKYFLHKHRQPQHWKIQVINLFELVSNHQLLSRFNHY